jgi:penicillin-binding protein 1A
MKKFIRIISITALVGGSLSLVSFGVIVWIALSDLPSIDALKNYQPPQSTVVYDRNSRVIGHFYDERRTVISLKDLPAYTKHAFIAAEDGEFFGHNGIDYWGLIRAIGLEIRYRTIGGRREGGSTITQQVARTMLLSSSQTYVRKIKEMVLAKRIEEALSKSEILHLYLNQIYFGNGAYGIEEAAQTYFFKPAKNLAIHEAAALASIPKSPNRINPFGDVERLKQRQHYVLDQMVKHEFIEQKEADKAKSSVILRDESESKDTSFAQYFLRSVKVELLAKISDEKIRRGGLKVYSSLDLSMQKKAEEILSDGLRVIDKRNGFRGPLYRPKENREFLSALQKFKEKVFINNLSKIWDLSDISSKSIKDIKQVIDSIKITKIGPNKIVGALVISVDKAHQEILIDLGSMKVKMPYSHMDWIGKKAPHEVIRPNDIIMVKLKKASDWQAYLEQKPEINGGLIALDVETGGVLAMVGGDDFQASPFNRITQAKRQPGSGIKPLIYALAIDKELATAATIITDAPKAFLDSGTGDFWKPRNHTNKYLGDITFRQCLTSSINTCTISLLEKMGIGTFLDLAQQVELSTPQTPYQRNLTLALGSSESFPINVANAMRILANQGQYGAYHMINSIKIGGKKEIIPMPEYKQVLRPESAFIITNILQDVVRNADKYGYLSTVASSLAGKTGTTNNARSAWFFGYSPRKILALVYVGYDDNRSIGSNEWGSTTAFPIWARFMSSIGDHAEPLRFIPPANIEWRVIDRYSGKLAELVTTDQETNTLITEAFISGTAPTEEDAKEPILDEAFAP